MQHDAVAYWAAPRVTALGPLVVVALIDGATLAGTATAGGWWFAVAATAVGALAGGLIAASFVKLTATEVVFRNGVFVTRLARPLIEAIEPDRDGVDIYYWKGDDVRVASAVVTGVLAGYFGGSRTAAIAKELRVALGVGAPSPSARRIAKHD